MSSYICPNPYNAETKSEYNWTSVSNNAPNDIGLSCGTNVPYKGEMLK